MSLAMSLRRLAAAALAGNALANPLRSRQDSTVFTSDGNPILSDGSVYSADPAPFVVNETVYVLTGHDEAPPGVNDFIMNEWQIFEAVAPKPEGGEWTLHRGVASPQNVFAWANPGGAYASQIIPGPDGRYYLYASVTQRGATTQDAFGVGVAASSSPTGPFVDIHPSGPIISQSVPEPNNIHNIDPVVLIDDDGRVFVYWGSFNNLRGVELDASDMVTPKGSIVSVNSLTGFFEAPWLMRRADTYYMLYAANNAGPDSPCTPTSYHACIAYGTSPGPLGPWTFRGVVLPIVSSTTSHPGVYELGGRHHLVYHTADAVEGGHFRRSVALDLLDFDDTSSPPAIRQVKQTFRAALTAPRPPNRNVAPLASSVTSLNPTPIQYWTAALNDERILQSPLPPDYWSSWAGDRSPQRNVLTYTWDQAVRLNGVAMAFFADSPAGSNVGVAPPAEWYVEFLNASGTWERLAATSAGGYVTAVSNTPAEVSFREVETTSLRATLVASGSGSTFAAVGVKEWFAFSPEPVAF